MIGFKSLRHALLLGVAAFGGAVTVSAVESSAYAQEVTRTYNIQPQDLNSALREFAVQTGRDVLYPPEIVAGRRSSGAQGQLTERQALEALLAGTGLRFEQTASNGYAVQDPSSPSRLGAETDAASSIEDEIIVTAQKREERLLDTPQSVSVVSSEALEQMGATQFRDFADTIPGLTFNSVGAGNTQVNLRGVTIGQDVSATVGIYVDDVPYGSSSGFAQGGQLALDAGLFDLTRIEVLRGPQGTLYGASTMGGLIKYVTNAPDPSAFAVNWAAGAATTSDGAESYNANLVLNIPVADNSAAFRIGAFHARDGGYIDNRGLGEDDVNTSEIQGGRIDFLLEPTNALSIRLVAFAQDIERDGTGTADYSFAGVPDFGELDQRRLLEEPFEQQFRLISGTISYDLGGATITSITGYQEMDILRVNDLSRQFVPLLALPLFGSRTYSAVANEQIVDTDKVTQELRIASDGNERLDWLAGVFYTEEYSGNRQRFILRDAVGAPAPNDVYNYYAPTSYYELAAFANLTLHVTDRFDVSAGARYAENEQESTQIGSGILIGSFPTRSAEEDVLTYLANARYRLGERTTAYARYATGYRPGGPNFVANDPVTGLPLGPGSFEADELTSYELGLRSETADRRFGIDVAVFHIDWSNIQLLASRNGFSVVANGPGATIDGAELSVQARPIDGLVLSGVVGYQDATLSENAPDVRGIEGETLPNVPQFTGSLNADWTLTGSQWEPTIGATVRYVGERRASFNASTGFRQYFLPEYTALDLRAGVTLNTVQVQFYARNVFDERGQLAAFTNRGYAQVAIMQPRTIGVRLSSAF